MDWIFDNFQIVALIGIAFASWLKHRSDLKRAEQEEQAPMEDEDAYGPTEGWEPPVTQPQPSVPPPLYRQSPPPIPRESMTTHSREQESELVLKRQQEMQERIRQIKESKANTTGGASATRARVAAAQSKAKPMVAGKTGIAATLRDPRELKKAVILREILGPPLGLR